MAINGSLDIIPTMRTFQHPDPED
ncbi:transcriptional regulator, partial [Pseudomonas syringae]|nr:transcriptional regulator [Pseudomonas syringae]